jgi:hypothetical protein
MPGGRSDGANLGSGNYVLPLVGRYAIYREDLDLPEAGEGRYRLVEVRNSRVPWNWVGVVEKVKQVDCKSMTSAK